MTRQAARLRPRLRDLRTSLKTPRLLQDHIINGNTTTRTNAIMLCVHSTIPRTTFSGAQAIDWLVSAYRPCAAPTPTLSYFELATHRLHTAPAAEAVPIVPPRLHAPPQPTPRSRRAVHRLPCRRAVCQGTSWQPSPLAHGARCAQRSRHPAADAARRPRPAAVAPATRP